MQYQLDVVKEVINIFLKNRKEGKNQLIEWFLNNVMEEGQEYRSHSCHTREPKKKGYRNGTRTRKLKTVDGTLDLKKA